MTFFAVNVPRPRLSLSYTLAILSLIAVVSAYQAVVGSVGLNDLPLVLPFGLGLVLVFLCVGHGRRLVLIALTLASVVIAFFLAGLFDDTFYDGITYHQSGIFWASQNFAFWTPKMDDYWAIFSNHYPKLSWLFGSAFLGPEEFATLSKSLNWLTLLATVSISWAAFEHQGKILRTSLALALALNPITLSQLFSNYVDGVMANLLVIAALTLWMIISTSSSLPVDRHLVSVFVLSLIFMTGLKFTGLMFAAVFAAVFLLFVGGRVRLSSLVPSYGIERRTSFSAWFKNNWAWSAALACLSLVLLWNPYFSNMSLGKPPLYPAVGTGRLENLISAQTTDDFYTLGSAQKLFTSIFSRAVDLGPQSSPTLPELKLPFSVDPAEIATFALVDTRIGGWGPLIGGLVLLGILGLLFFAQTYRTGSGGAYWVIIATVLVTLFANPESWWARFAPQLASLPLLALGLWRFPRQATRRMSLAKSLLPLSLTISILNSTLVLVPMIVNVSTSNSYMALQVQTLKSNSAEQTVLWHKQTFNLEPFFARQGVEWELKENDDFSGNYCTLIYGERVCSK